VQSAYAPGSTFKLVTSTAALESGLITPNTTKDDKGFLMVGKTRFNNANNARFGLVNLPRAIGVSSDAYFYELGADMYGDRRIQDAAKAYGLGVKTGITLGGEAKGLIIDADWKKKWAQDNPGPLTDAVWRPGDGVVLAIGQGISVSPLQLANAYAAFANGGTVWQPRLASQVVDQDGNVVRQEAPKQLSKVTMTPEHRAAIEQGLVWAATGPKGTAVDAFKDLADSGFTVAGKTGTAEVKGKQDTAVFSSYGPVGNPQYEVTVLMEESGFGGQVAAPVARRIYDGLLNRPLQPVKFGNSVD
jgi:penicillin-binding protein 2